MEILFERGLPKKPKVSFVLLDWSCRESFHILHYLNQQNVPRDYYEIIWIEYYQRRSPEIRKSLEDCARQAKPPILDQWIVMDMPETLYYHKHLMYNIGMVLSRGEIVTICDSDAMVRPTFIETIIKSFKKDPNIALHMDEVRNNDPKFHPFSFPSFDQVQGEGSINFTNGTTTGLLDTEDPLHTLNYGACFSARRDDLISIGGADEHLDYLGHVCGPYEMTFRLKNLGKKEVWHPSELLYHVWHPGQAGNGNYVGPHDGMHMSSTALKAMDSGRIQPLLENKAIRALRENSALNPKILIPKLIDSSCFDNWTYEAMSESSSFYVWETAELVDSIFHYNIVRHMGVYFGLPQSLGPVDLNKKEERDHPDILAADTHEGIKNQIEQVFLGNNEKSYSTKPQGRDSLRSQIYSHIRRINNILKPDYSNNSPAPTLLDSHRGYNLVQYGENLFGVPFTLGKIDLSELDANDLPLELIVASSQDTVKSLIDELMNMPEGKVLEEYEHFNIIKWGGVLYGIPQFFGPVDQETVESEEGSLFPKGSTLENLKNQIDHFNHSPGSNVTLDNITEDDLDQHSVLSGLTLEEVKHLIIDSSEIATSPDFIEEQNGYNIVNFKNMFWGIPRTLGEMDLTQETNLNHPSILSAKLLEELINLIDETVEMTAPPKLIGERDNYNIIKYRNRFWGISHTLGEVDITQEETWDDPSIASASSLEEINNLIELNIGLTTAPELMEVRNNFNIVKYKNRYWCIPLALGDANITNQETMDDPSILSADSLKEAKNQADKSVGLDASPKLIEAWKCFNIIIYKNRYWGIPHALGDVDITTQAIRRDPSILSADSLDEIKDQIEDIAEMQIAPEFIEEIQNYNVLKYKKYFWAIPTELGEVDLTQKEQLNHPAILSSDTIEALKGKIDVEIGWSAPPKFMGELNGYNLIKYRNRFYGIPQEREEINLTHK